MNRSLRQSIFLLAIACLPNHAVPGPAAARAAPSDGATRYDLGGACDDGDGSAAAEIHTEFREAARLGDHRRLIDLHKRYVRAMCSNRYRWFGLAEAYLDDGQTATAIQVLHELHRRGAEIKPSAFEHHAKLAELLDTPQFRQSDLNRVLQELRAEAARRRNVHRSRLERLEVSARPPADHVARGACPFECCSYREWNVLTTTPLYQEPFGTAVIGSAVQGTQVRGVTGDVHVTPLPVAVVHDRPPFVRGEIIFVLDYLGEGFHRYWRNGVIAEDELWFDEICLRPSRDCWAEQILPPDDRREPQWWILIETDEDVRGWTDQSANFGNKDACG